MRPIALVLFAVSAALAAAFGSEGSAAPVPKHLMKAPENPDLAAMQGEWKLTNVTLHGESLGAEFAATLELAMEIRGNRSVTTGLKYKQRITTVLVLDVNANPRRMTSSDTTETDLDGKPVAVAKKTAVGIYKIEGDTLTLAGRSGDEETAPKDFVGKDVVSMTFTRVKK